MRKAYSKQPVSSESKQANNVVGIRAWQTFLVLPVGQTTEYWSVDFLESKFFLPKMLTPFCCTEFDRDLIKVLLSQKSSDP